MSFLWYLIAAFAIYAPATGIIASCHGPYCVLFHKAVAIFRNQGLDSRQMEAELPEWCKKGRHWLRRPPVSKSEFLGSQCLAERLRVRVPRHAEPT